MKRAIFIDTWAWIILSNRKEHDYQPIQHLYKTALQNRFHIVTSDYVLDETITFLYAKMDIALAEPYITGIFSSIKGGGIDLERVTEKRFQEAWKLRLKYNDHARISFTDLTSFVIMKEKGITHVVTQDDHFSHVNMGFQRLLKPKELPA